MAEDNIARVGISLDSAAFQDGVSRALRDIDRLLSGLKTLQNANRQISLAAGGGLFGSGSKSPVANFARDISRTAIPALRDMERNALRVGGAVRRSMADISRMTAQAEQAQLRQERSILAAERRTAATMRRRGRSYRDEGLFGSTSSNPNVGSFEDPRSPSGKIAARYVLRTLEELITSEAESYPRIMQPRPRGGAGRTASRGSEETVQNVATKFAPGRIFNTSTNLEEGLPVTIVGPGGERFVLSGNGRVMGMRRLANAPQGRVPIVSAVEGFVASNPSLFGGSQGVEEVLKQVAKIAREKKTPVLTRELVQGFEEIGAREAGKLGLGLNTRTAMSEAEMAMAVSKLLQKTPSGLAKGTPGKILSSNSPAVQEFIGQVLEVLPPQVVRSRYQTSSGSSNKQFQQLLEGVAMSSAYGNNPATEAMITRLLEGGATGLPPAYSAALRRNLGPQLTLRGRISAGEIPAEMDPIYNNLPQALELLNQAKKAFGPRFMAEQIGTQQGMEPASPQAIKLAQAMRTAGSTGLPAFFEAIAQYGKRAVSATAPTLGLDPSSFTADPEAALRIASAAASKYASHQGAKTEEVLSSIVESAIREFATPEALQPVAKKAARGSASAKVQKAVEEKVEQVAEVVSEAVTDPRSTVMRRPESQRFYKINPRAIGEAEGSEKLRAGGYLPYSEASEPQRGKFNMALLGGYATLEREYEAAKKIEALQENRPEQDPIRQKVVAMAAELQRLKGIMIERGLAQPTVAQQLAELFTSPTGTSAPGLTPTRTAGGGSGGGGGGGGRRRTASGGGEEEEGPKTPKWIQSFQSAIATSGLDPQSLRYMTAGFKFGNARAMIEPNLFGQSRANLEAMQQFAAVRQMQLVRMSGELIEGNNGYWQPIEAGERGGIGLGGFASRTAAPLLRTFIHEIAHGTFGALMAGGYKPQTTVPLYGPKGEFLGPSPARPLLSKWKEGLESGHVDPAFYRSQAMISQAGGALLPQLAFHRMVEEIMPEGHLTEGIGMGKYSQLLTPHLKELANPQQSQAAEEFVKFSARIMEAASNFTQGSTSKGNALAVMSEGLQQLGASSQAFPSTFFLEAASVVGNALKSLSVGDPDGLTNVVKSLMNAAALTVGEGEFRPGVAVAANAAREVSNYLSSASIEEKAAIALGANPKLLGDTSFNPGNEEHVRKVNEAIASIAATAAQTSKGVALARFTGGQRVETPYAGVPGLLGKYAPGALMSQTSPLVFPGGTFAERMQWYASQSGPRAAIERSIPGAYFRAQEARFTGIGPAYNQAYASAKFRIEQQQEYKSLAKQEFQQSANAAARYAEVQSRLNLIVQNGNLNFTQLSRVLTDAGNGFTVSTVNALKFAAAIAVGQQITGSIVSTFEHLKGGIIGFNAMLEAASVGFTTLFKNAGRSVRDANNETAKTIKTLRDFANVTNFRFGDLQTAALRMQAFGFEVDTARAQLKRQMPVLYEVNNALERNATGLRTFKGALVAIGDAVAALGGEDDKLRRITYALGQMNSAGRVYQNDMMQLANAGIAGYDILAKALLQEIEANPELKKANAAIYNKLLNPETAVEEVRRLAKSGRLFGPGAVQAILKGLEERYGGGMKAFSRTFQGAMTTVADTSQSLVATGFRPLFDVVRDLTIQLADFLQQPEAEKGAERLSNVILRVANAIRTGLPPALSIANKVFSAIVDTFSSLAGAAASGTSSLGGFVKNVGNGLAALGKIIENDVVRQFGSALVVAKLLFSFIASNPLLATITAGTAGIGFLASAIEENQFGLGDAFSRISGPLEAALGRIGSNILPSLSNTLTSAASVIGATVASIMTAIAPLLEVVLKIVDAVTVAIKPFSSVLGIALALFIGKKVLIDGVASAMARFATFTGDAAKSLDNMKTRMFGVKELQAFKTFGQNTIDSQLIAPQKNREGELIAPGELRVGPVGGPGTGLASPGLYKAYIAMQQELAASKGWNFKALQNLTDPINGELAGASKINLESTPIQYNEAMNVLGWLKTMKTNEPERYKALSSSFAPSEKLQLEEAMNASIRTVVTSFKELVQTLRNTPGAFNKLQAAVDFFGLKLSVVANAATGFGLTLSTVGALLNNQFLTEVGGAISSISFAITGLATTFNLLKTQLALSSFASGLTMAVAGLAVFTAALLEGDPGRRQKNLDALEELYGLRARIGEDEFNKQYGRLDQSLRFQYEMGMDLTAEQEALIKQIKAANEQYAAEQRELRMESYRGKGSARYRLEKDLEQVEGYAIRGYTPEQIAMFTGKSLAYIQSLYKRLVDDGTEAGQEYIKILTAQLDASGEALQKARDMLQKATDAFQRPLNRLMSRVQTLLSALFEEEKKLLEEQKNAALNNIEVLFDGEVMRLGVLQEQYDTLTKQREEMEEMQRLEDARTKASEAALAMFDAGSDPLERARAARDAARELFSESEQMRLKAMGTAIEQAKGSVQYGAVSQDYDSRIKALEVDQAERQRVLSETIDDLMRKVQNGKLSAEEAKKMLQDAFAQTGLDLGVAAQQGYDFMEHFSSGFMSALEKNIDLTFKRLPTMLAAAIKALREDAAYKKAQEDLNNLLNPQPVDKTVPGSDMLDLQKTSMERARRTLQALQLAEYSPQLTPEQKQSLRTQMSAIQEYILKLSKNPFSSNLMYTEAERSLVTQNFSDVTGRGIEMLTALLGYDNVLQWIFGGIPMASRPGTDNKRAAGGAVGAGTYMVGERGPELLQMYANGGGYVIPNHKLPSHMRSSAAALGGGIMGRAWGGGVGPVNPEAPWNSRSIVVSHPTSGGINDWHEWAVRSGKKEGMKYSFDWGDVIIDEDAYENLGPIDKFLQQLSMKVKKSVFAAPEGMFDPRNPRTRPEIHITGKGPAAQKGAIAQMASTLSSKIALYATSWSDSAQDWQINNPAEMIDALPHEFGHIVHNRANMNRFALSRAGIMDYLSAVGSMLGGGHRPRPGGGPGPTLFTAMSEMTPELGLYGAAKGIPNNQRILDSIDAIGKRNTLGNTFFPGGHYESNYGEMYAELFSHWVESGMGKMTLANAPEGGNEYLRSLAAKQGWRSYAGSYGSKLPELSGKLNAPGYGIRRGNILYNNRAQAGIGSLLDIGQMAATGTLSAAGVAASAGLNALSLIPKIGGPLAAVAGLGLTAATGGDVLRAAFSTVGSIGGGLLGGLLGSFLAPGAGTVALGLGGSMTGGALFGSIYDLLFGKSGYVGSPSVQGSFRRGAFEIPNRAWGGPVLRPHGDNFTNFGDKGRTTGQMPAAFLNRFIKYGQSGLRKTPWEKYVGGGYMPVYGNAVNAWWDRITVADSVPFSSLPKYQQLDEIISGRYLPPEFYSGNKNNLSYAELMASRGARFPGVVQGWLEAYGEKPAVTYWDPKARQNNPEHAELLKYNKLYNWWRNYGQFGNYKGYDDPYYRWTKTYDPKTGALTDTWPESAKTRMADRVVDLVPEISTWMLNNAGPMTESWFGKQWTLEQYKSSPWGKKMFGPWEGIMFGEGGLVGDIEEYARRVQQGWMGERYAAGGSYRQNRAFLVGENGPEIMIPGGIGGSIIPNHKLRAPGNIGAIASGQSVNASVIINNPTVSSSADIDRLATKVAEAQTRALRAAGYVRPS